MSRIIYWIFFALCIVISSIFLKIIFLKKWENDCMVQYVLSEQKSWYIYKLDSLKYHIDTIDYGNSIEKIWVSNGCAIVTYDPKFSFMAITNLIYCEIVSLAV
jgi:hypothetical protein